MGYFIMHAPSVLSHMGSPPSCGESLTKNTCPAAAQVETHLHLLPLGFLRGFANMVEKVWQAVMIFKHNGLFSSAGLALFFAVCTLLSMCAFAAVLLCIHPAIPSSV